MIIDYSIQQYSFGKMELQLAIPNPAAIQHEYHLQKQQDASLPFPYWAKVWPSAIALCQFLTTQNQLIKDKKVIELAAGLGLPSILACKYAYSVYSSDYSVDCILFIKKSIELNAINNMSWGVLDWSILPYDLTADVVLMSDVNYDATQFEILYNVFLSFLNKGILIIMTTPQRLMAKPFIEKLLPYVLRQEEMIINHTLISVLVLQQS
jgi:predicted nicotinamide N-methyase